jgi:hypothetical protein
VARPVCFCPSKYAVLKESQTRLYICNLRCANKQDKISTLSAPSPRAAQLHLETSATSIKMSGTPFIKFQGPSSLISDYNARKGPFEQSPTIPKTFIDAMEIREQVFVLEQGVPLDNEFDSDDSRSCHWVSCYCPSK